MQFLIIVGSRGHHSIHDDLFIGNPSDTPDRYMAVFKKIFEVTGQKGHYNMMMCTKLDMDKKAA